LPVANITADIPGSLLKEWNSVRRRRARTIRKLEKEPLAEEP
jgi:hypothetical protein